MWRSASLAFHKGLGRLVCLFENFMYFDSNWRLSIDAHLRHIGELMIQNQVGMMDAFRPALLEHNVLSAEGFDARRQAEVAELNNDKLELMAPYWFAWGRKNPKSV